MRRRDIVLMLEGLLKEDNRRKLHLSICINGFYKFYNGECVDFRDPQVLNFIDRKLGYIAIPFSQIINVEPMKE